VLSKYNNVLGVAEDDLCLSCGTCVTVCPTSAIKIGLSNDKGIYEPFVNESKCTLCKLCVDVCPGLSVDFTNLNNNIFRKQPDVSWIGNFQKCYIGYVTDKNIRKKATSGGLVSQILIYLLESGKIDGALVTKMSEKNPFMPFSFIARSREEILSAAVSKYCPVPLNSSLDQIVDKKGKYAVVGLPCHLHGIRKLEMINEKLKNNIVFHIGLFCSHNVSFTGTNFVLEKNNIRKSNVSKFYYRGNGWPGHMQIFYKNGSIRMLPFDKDWYAYWTVFSPYFFTPKRCIMCTDLTSELADISFGDAWLPEFSNDKDGMSMIISRNDDSETMLSDLYDKNIINIKKIDQSVVKRSQGFNILYKKHDLANRLSILNSRNNQVPLYNPKPKITSSIKSTIRNMFIIFNVKISLDKLFYRSLVKLPTPFFRLYTGINKLLYDIGG